MRSTVVNGKVLEWRYEIHVPGLIYNFYIGDIFIGRIIKMGKADWTPVNFHTLCSYKNIRGFRSRAVASEFMLKGCDFGK